jgi:hypothetical protein
MFKTAIGHSDDVDSKDAIIEVLEQCQQELGNYNANAGILYSAIDHEYSILLEEINKAHPDIELIGGTFDGEMSSLIGFTEDSITLVLFVSDEVDIKAGVATDILEKQEVSIAEAIKITQSTSNKKPALCFLIAAGVTTSGMEITNEFTKGLGDSFPIFGISSGDQWEFKTNYQFYNTRILEDSVSFLMFSGPLLYGAAVKTGWEPRGNFSRITRSQRNIVYEIDNRSAVSFYQEYIGNDLSHAATHPLAVFEDDNSDNFYLRAPFLPNLEDGSIVFAGDLIENSRVKISYTNSDKIIAAAKAAVTEAKETYPGTKPAAVLCTSCAARKQVLGTRTVEEIALVSKSYPNLKTIGAYGYGEFAPHQKGSPSRYHNETFISLFLGTE